MTKEEISRFFPKQFFSLFYHMVVLTGLFRTDRTRKKWETPFSGFSCATATLVSVCRDYNGIVTHPALKVDSTSAYE